MRKRTLIATWAFVALTAVGVVWAAIGRPEAPAQKAAVDCCFDPACPPGCKPSCPPDCTDGAKSANGKHVEKKAKGACPPCGDCP